MNIRKGIILTIFFVVGLAAIIFLQGMICFGDGCSTTNDGGNVGLDFGGESVNPTSNPVSSGVEYVPISYQEEKEISAADNGNDGEYNGSNGSGESANSNEQVPSVKESRAIPTIESPISRADTSAGNSKSGTVNSLPVIMENCYGAEACNPTGSPIGGGAGYSRVISQSDPSVKYVVSTKSQLLSALASAKTGDVVFVKGTSTINMAGTSQVVIPAGVTLASDRGLGGSSGALIVKKTNTSPTSILSNEATFLAGNGARITGFRMEGEMEVQNGSSVPYRQYLRALATRSDDTMEVDNCELYGWSYAAITVGDHDHPSGYGYIHHNYIHHNQALGLGYGIEVYGGETVIEANIFDYNRHSIAAAGVEGESYEARYNLELGHGNPGLHRFDIHPNPDGKSYSGYSYQIHHNTFGYGYPGISPPGNSFAMSIGGAEPELGIWIDHNMFTWSESWDKLPVFSYASAKGRSKTFAVNNMIGIPPTILKSDENGIIQFSAE